MKNIYLLLLLLFPLFTNTVSAHEHHSHSDSAGVIEQTLVDTNAQHIEPGIENSNLQGGFPNYHPIIVHFPIVLLIFSAIIQLFSFFFYRKELSFVVLFLLALGVIGAWLSINIFHAHPGELPVRAEKLFETHLKMATYTWWLSLSAFIIKLLSHIFLKRKLWIEVIAAILLLASAVTVSIAGHHGAMLVHIEGVGPQGHYLESHEHDEH